MRPNDTDFCEPSKFPLLDCMDTCDRVNRCHMNFPCVRLITYDGRRTYADDGTYQPEPTSRHLAFLLALQIRLLLTTVRAYKLYDKLYLGAPKS